MKKDFIRLRNVKIDGGNRDRIEDISISIFMHEIHAIVLDNHDSKEAFKSLLAGRIKTKKGSIYLEEKQLSPETICDYFKNNVFCICGTDALIEEISVAENIFLLNGKNSCGQWISRKRLRAECMKLFKKMDICGIDPLKSPCSLSEYEKRLVLLVRALSAKPELIVLDDICRNLHTREVENLTNVIKHMKTDGLSIVYISNQPKEVRAVSDRISVMREGRIVVSTEIAGKNYQYIENIMLNFKHARKKCLANVGHEVLKVEGVSTNETNSISFTINEGEVLFMTGDRGTQLANIGKILAGLQKSKRGDVYINGKLVRINSIYEAVKHKIGYISEEGVAGTILPSISLSGNICLNVLDKISKYGVINKKLEKHATDKWKQQLNIVRNNNVLAEKLNREDQIKLVMARWLAAKPKLLIIDSISTGMSYGLREQLMESLRQFIQDGSAVLVLANGLSAVSEYADRIIIMSNKDIYAEICGNDDEMKLLRDFRGNIE